MFYEAPADHRGKGERATQSPSDTIKELYDLKREYPGKTSFSDEITGAYINKKKRRGQIGGALIGGALGTGAGAVLGSRLIPNKGIRMATGGVLGAGLGGYAGGRIERGRARENVLHASNTQRKAVAALLSRLATAQGKSYTVSNADGSKSMRFNPQEEERKTAMFYDVLMEKKANKQRKKEKPGALSHLGSLAGAAGGAYLGGQLGAGAALTGTLSGKMSPKLIAPVIMGGTALGAGAGSGLGGGGLRGVAGGTVGGLAGGAAGTAIGSALRTKSGMGGVYGGLAGSAAGAYLGNRLARKD